MAVGVVLPLISLQRSQGFPNSILERIALPDVLVTSAVLALILRYGGRAAGSALLYAAAVAIAGVIGLFYLSEAGIWLPDGRVGVLAESLALFVAFGYWLFGSQVARSDRLVRMLLLGLAVGVLWEGVIVAHDYLAASDWFPSPNSNRVRGTFRTTGQLGAFGFSAAGIMFVFGSQLPRRRQQLFAYSMGILAVLMVVAASRRSVILTIGMWPLVYLLLAFPQRRFQKMYLGVVALVVLMILGVARFTAQVTESYAGGRLLSAAHSIQSGESMPVIQARAAVQHLGEWLPFGVGPGNSRWFLPLGLEIHNAHLALAVDLGLLGLVSFYLLLWRLPLTRRPPATRRSNIVSRQALLAFLACATVVMLHNRLHRERGFMLFLGIAAQMAAVSTVRPRNAPQPCAVRRRH
jgi:hypothetical protein